MTKSILLKYAIRKVCYKEKIPRNKFLVEGKYPVVSQEQEPINGRWDDEKAVNKIERPIIVFGDHTKALKFIDFDFVLGADGVKILDPIDEIDPRYFYYALQNIKLEDLGYARHFRILKEAKISYPESVEEQRRIVKKLDEAFATIDQAKQNTEKNLQNSQELFDNQLLELFGNNSEWEIKRLPDIAEYFNGLTYSPKDVSDKGTIVLRSSNVQNDKLYFVDIVRVNRPIKEKIMVKDGDILMCSRNGSKRLIGKTATIKDLKENMTFGTFMMIVRSQYNPYLAWFFKSKEFRAQMARGENTSINQITRYMLDDVSVPFPPTERQEEIVKDLGLLSDQTKKLQELYRKKLTALEELRQSILKQAFEGKL